MNQDSRAVLSSFMDGEPVDADVLAAALQAPGAPEALVDFARLRAELADDDPIYLRPIGTGPLSIDGLARKLNVAPSGGAATTTKRG